ncbi:MAG: DNA repair protein RecO [Aureispira sp.]|nr:DNA repair protein RecO [Aureispira sp.]
MLKTVQGIVVRSVKYSETSVICDVYTKELGMRTYIASGVRKQKSRISPNLVRPMALIEAVVYHQDNKDINRLKEVKPLYIYQQVPFEVKRGAIGLFITEVVQKTIKESDSNEVLFDFLLSTYQFLDVLEDKNLSNFHLVFMVKLSAYLGFLPAVPKESFKYFLDYREGTFLLELPAHIYHFNEYQTNFLIQISQLDFSNLQDISLSNSDRRAFLENLLRFYEYHIENFANLHSHIILHEVLN